MLGGFLLGSVRGSISMFYLVSFPLFLYEDEGELGGGTDCGFQVCLGARKVVLIVGLVDEGTTAKRRIRRDMYVAGVVIMGAAN